MKSKNRKWAQKAIKESGGNTDLDEKFRTIYLLRDHYGLHGLVDEVVFIPRNGKTRHPDILIKACDPQIAILLHGDAPWHTEGSETELNVKMDYDSAGVKLIIIWEALTQYKKERILEALDVGGLERIT